VCAQALTLPEKYKQGRLLAGQLLCQCVLRRHDFDLDDALLSRFYAALHAGLVHSDPVCPVITADIFMAHPVLSLKTVIHINCRTVKFT